MLLLALLLLIGCHSHGTPGEAGKEYDLKGKVVAVDRAKSTVKVAHEDIPGLMKAMTMDFSVEDPKQLDGLAEGDAIQARLRVQAGKYVLTKVEKR
jgi:protein SCO1/2